MRRALKRGIRRLALVAIAVPVVAWALEQAAQRLEARGAAAWWSQRLRGGAELLGRQGRGPLAKRLRRPTRS
jgi:hypothetical protein